VTSKRDSRCFGAHVSASSLPCLAYTNVPLLTTFIVTVLNNYVIKIVT